jgi:hypothetical protein
MASLLFLLRARRTFKTKGEAGKAVGSTRMEAKDLQFASERMGTIWPIVLAGKIKSYLSEFQVKMTGLFDGYHVFSWKSEV